MPIVTITIESPLRIRWKNQHRSPTRRMPTCSKVPTTRDKYGRATMNRNSEWKQVFSSAAEIDWRYRRGGGAMFPLHWQPMLGLEYEIYGSTIIDNNRANHATSNSAACRRRVPPIQKHVFLLHGIMRCYFAFIFIIFDTFELGTFYVNRLLLFVLFCFLLPVSIYSLFFRLGNNKLFYRSRWQQWAETCPVSPFERKHKYWHNSTYCNSTEF